MILLKGGHMNEDGAKWTRNIHWMLLKIECVIRKMFFFLVMANCIAMHIHVCASSGVHMKVMNKQGDTRMRNIHLGVGIIGRSM